MNISPDWLHSMDILPGRLYYLGYTKEGIGLSLTDGDGPIMQLPAQLRRTGHDGYLYHWQGRLYCEYGRRHGVVIFDIVNNMVIYGDADAICGIPGRFHNIIYPDDDKIQFYKIVGTTMSILSIDLRTLKSNTTTIHICESGTNIIHLQHLPYDRVRGVRLAVIYSDRHTDPVIATQHISDNICIVNIRKGYISDSYCNVHGRFLWYQHRMGMTTYDIYSGEEIFSAPTISFTPLTDNVVMYLINGDFNYPDIVVYKNLSDGTEYRVCCDGDMIFTLLST